MLEVAGEIGALHVAQMQRERQLVVRAEGVLREQRDARPEVLESLLVGRSSARTLACRQVHARQLESLGRVRDQVNALVQLIDDIEDPLANRPVRSRARRSSTQDSTDTQVGFRARRFTQAGVGSLLDPVVHEAIVIVDLLRWTLARELDQCTHWDSGDSSGTAGAHAARARVWLACLAA